MNPEQGWYDAHPLLRSQTTAKRASSRPLQECTISKAHTDSSDFQRRSAPKTPYKDSTHRQLPSKEMHGVWSHPGSPEQASITWTGAVRCPGGLLGTGPS